MFATVTPYVDDASPSTWMHANACIPVRVTDEPRSDGSLLVYLPDGTAFVVNGRELLRLERGER
jgi:hypothetical protein